MTILCPHCDLPMSGHTCDVCVEHPASKYLREKLESQSRQFDRYVDECFRGDAKK